MNPSPYDPSQYLVLNRRQTSWLIGATMALLCLAFLVGYFWGQHTAIEQWLDTTQQHHFADQIYTSLYTRYDTSDTDDTEESDASETSPEPEPEQPPHEDVPQKRYYAPLIGYKAAQKKEAERFAAKLKQQGINTLIRERSSRSKRGRTVLWYQVVTDYYTDPNALKAALKRIKQQYKLHDTIDIIEEPLA